MAKGLGYAIFFCSSLNELRGLTAVEEVFAVAVSREGEEEREEEAEEESMVCICMSIEDVYHDELAGVVACFPPAS